MVKKMFYLLVVIAVAFSFNTTLFAQEEEQLVEDVADISLEDLLNVEITTAGKQAEKISEIPASVVLVTREDIEKYGYQTLSEILQNIPGLYYTNDYFVENFGVRGFWSVVAQRNVIILINDVPQTNEVSTANFFHQINIPVESIDRIEVVRGPMSVIYGTGAFFGAINIFTNRSEEEPFSQVSVSAGSDKTFQLFVRSSGNVEDFRYAFNASYFDTDGINAPYDQMGPLTGTTEGLLENQSKYFNFSGSFKGFTFDASYTEADKELMIFTPPVGEGSLGSTSAVRLFFGYDKQLTDKFRLSAKLGYFLNSLDTDFDFLFPNFYGVQLDGSSGYHAELNMFFNPSDKVNITFGVNYRKIMHIRNDFTFPIFGFDPLETDLVKGNRKVIQSIFGQLNFKLSENLKLVLGARVEQVPEFTIKRRFSDLATATYSEVEANYSQTDPAFIPRAALIWGIDDKNYIKLLYGKALNRPSILQIIDGVLGPLGYSDLEPETIQTVEFNYIGTLSPKFQVSMSVFYNILDKLIYRSLFQVGSTVISREANVGEIQTTGAELTLTARPLENFHLELSGTYQDTKDKRDGFEDIDVGYAPKFLGYIKAALFLNDDISIAVTGNYVDEMYAYYDDTLATPARLGEKVDGYFLLGANLRIRKLFGTGFFINVRGSNLLDQEIHYPATSNNSSFLPLGSIGKGMSFLFTLGYKFIPIP